MDIQYLGEAAFLLKGERTVAVNPPHASVAADIRLTSRRQDPSKVTVSGPGEYEIGGVLIETVEAGEKDQATLAHAIEIGDATVLHLGERVNELRGAVVDALGAIDVLLVDTGNLEAAKRAVTIFEPAITVPFGEHAAELVKELGVTVEEPESRFVWRKGAEKPPKAVLLKTTKLRLPKPEPAKQPKRGAKAKTTARPAAKASDATKVSASAEKQAAAKKPSTRKKRAA
jgi:hypothetical protein